MKSTVAGGISSRSRSAGSPDAGLLQPAAGVLAVTTAATEVLGAIRSAGGRPYLVGGCVRDALLAPGQRPKDVDIEVFGLELDELTRVLKRVGRVDEVGRSFAVIKVRHGDETFDVSLPRAPVGSNAAGMLVSDDQTPLREAASRRDYTINALMFDPTEAVVLDFVGGLSDLREGVLRHSGPAFVEDPLRVLRGVQLAARFGFRLAPETAQVCRGLFPAYSDLSPERVWAEWRKLAEQGRHITAAVAALNDSGWLAHFPQLARLAGVPQDPRWHPEGDVLTHSGLAADAAAALADDAGLTGDDRTFIVLGGLLHDVGKAEHTQVHPDGRITSYGHADGGVAPARDLLTSIGAPSAVISRITPIVRDHMTATTTAGPPSSAAVRRLARRLAPASMKEWSLVCGADHAGRGSGSGPNPTTSWLTVAEAAGAEERPTPPLLRGHDLIALGHPPGPQYRSVMAAALAAQDEGVFTDHAGAVAWLDRMAADGRLAHLLAEGGRQGITTDEGVGDAWSPGDSACTGRDSC